MSARTLTQVSRRLAKQLAPLRFAAPVTHVYDPTTYARSLHEAYLERYGAGRPQAILLGMNPGPWGMAQTGVPFGEVAAVRDWMGLAGEVEKPTSEHPKRLVEGLACSRSEVSGRRLWGWAEERFGAAEDFFARFFVANYCPLSFMEESGKNRTPDKLPSAEREPLFAACDRALADVVAILRPEWVLGVGKFAEDRAKLVLGDADVRIGRILHPSPASPLANKGWAEAAEKQLGKLGFELP
jgi:single-strand selective monofunctional uracil DNA glycosylase